VCAEDYAFPWSGLIGEFKFQGDVALAQLLAQRMASVLRQTSGALEVDRVLPVPLSTQRLQERGFNQSWELARQLGQIFGLACSADLLLRPVDTGHQLELSLLERAHNLRGAFMVAPQQRQAIVGQRLALVDDVMTTGATLREATRALLEAGAASVDAWAVARTP
jgi:ComF family protein